MQGLLPGKYKLSKMFDAVSEALASEDAASANKLLKGVDLHTSASKLPCPHLLTLPIPRPALVDPPSSCLHAAHLPTLPALLLLIHPAYLSTLPTLTCAGGRPQYKLGALVPVASPESLQALERSEAARSKHCEPVQVSTDDCGSTALRPSRAVSAQ